MNIRDAMTADVSYVRPDTPILEIARKMRDADIGSLPVVDDERLIGMVTDRDIVVRVIAEGADIATATARGATPNGAVVRPIGLRLSRRSNPCCRSQRCCCRHPARLLS